MAGVPHIARAGAARSSMVHSCAIARCHSLCPTHFLCMLPLLLLLFLACLRLLSAPPMVRPAVSLVEILSCCCSRHATAIALLEEMGSAAGGGD